MISNLTTKTEIKPELVQCPDCTHGKDLSMVLSAAKADETCTVSWYQLCVARCDLDRMNTLGLRLPTLFCCGVMGLTQPEESDLRSFLEDLTLACKKEQYHLAEF